jgi:hypothetical protein
MANSSGMANLGSWASLDCKGTSPPLAIGVKPTNTTRVAHAAASDFMALDILLIIGALMDPPRAVFMVMMFSFVMFVVIKDEDPPPEGPLNRRECP